MGFEFSCETIRKYSYKRTCKVYSISAAAIRHLSRQIHCTRNSRYTTSRSKAFRTRAMRYARCPLASLGPTQQAAGGIKTPPLVLKTAVCPAVARDRRLLVIKFSIRRNRKTFIHTSPYQITFFQRDCHKFPWYHQQISDTVFFGKLRAWIPSSNT